LIAISAAAAAPWEGLPVHLSIAGVPTGAAMEDIVVERVHARSAC
jgi:hypothetical protein